MTTTYPTHQPPFNEWLPSIRKAIHEPWGDVSDTPYTEWEPGTPTEDEGEE